MTEEVTNNPGSPELVAPTEPTTSNEPPPEEPPPEVDEVEYEGKKYAVPREIKDALLRQADYTRKTQELAQTRREAEESVHAEREAVKREREAVRAHEEFAAVRAQLSEFAAVTPEQWQAAMQQDPQSAQVAWMKFQALKDKAQGLGNKIAQDEQRRALETQQATARRIEQAMADVRAEIPDWSDAKAGALKDYAQKLGAKAEALATVTDAWIVKALHKASLYDQISQKAKAAPTPTEPAKPVRTITQGKSTAGVDPDKLSTDEWLKWRNTQLRKSA